MPVAIDSRLLPLFFAIGRPFSPIYSGIMRLRAFFYQKGLFSSRSLPCPVVSIGNITMGGTGKTPHVLAVACHLAEKGLRVAVVTRGYGAKGKKMPFVVFNDGDVKGTPTLCGDEAFMLSEALSGRGVGNALVIVDHDRYRGGMLACELGAQVILLDDGFQHLSLRRDLDVVLFRHKKPLGNGRVFPGGDLREPLSALKRGQIFVFTGAEAVSVHEDGLERQDLPRDVFHIIEGRPVFFSHTRAIGLQFMNGLRTSPSELKGRPVLAFCGLADPESFYGTLKKLGADVKKTVSFSDHFAYKEENVRELMRLAEVFECPQLVTTRKDMVKLRSIPWAMGAVENASRIACLDVDIEIDTEFWEVIDHILNIGEP